MGFLQRGGLNINRPRPAAMCDRCGGVFRRDLLFPQMKYAGMSIVDTGWRVCTECLDPLDPQARPIIPAPDGLPILNARPINRNYATEDYRVTEATEQRITEDSDDRITEDNP